MRTLTATLKSAQQSVAINALVKLVLTYGTTTYTYTKTQILDIKETGNGSLQSLEILLNNSDGVLTALDLRGYKGVLSFGAITSAGEEYSTCAPMWVLAQEFDSDPNKLTCTLSLIGIANLMAQDEASASCIPKNEKNGTATSTIANHLIDTAKSQFKASDVGRVVHNTTDDTYASITEYNSQSNLTLDADIMVDGEDYEIWTEGSNDTIKTLVTAIIEATLPALTNCKAYTVEWDDGYDTLADTYRPKDAFRIYTRNNRWSAVQRLLDYTLNVAIVKKDGKIHIFKPTTSGETYDSEYNLESGHPFFAKALRNRIVTPGYIKVQSRDGDVPQYSGTAKDDDYDSLPDELKKQQYKQTYLESDDQAKDIAEAMLARAQMWCEAGAANVPLNVGTEAFDYVKVTDKREGDYRVGNIGKYVRHYDVRKNEWRMTFVFGNWQNVRKALDQLGITADDLENYFSRLQVGDLYVENLLAKNMGFYWIDPEGNIDLDKIGDNIDNLPDGEKYARVSTWNLKVDEDPESPTYGLFVLNMDEHTLYQPGYDPTHKFDLDTDTFDNIPEGVTFRKVKSAALSADGLVILDQVVAGTYGLIKSTDISAGHIKLDTVVTGTYGLVRDTDISSGHILLSSVEQTSSYQTVTGTQKTSWTNKPDDMDEIGEGTTYKRVKATEIDTGRIRLTAANYYSGKYDGKWYLDGTSSAGVSIVAGVGINIWGRNQALTTRATETGTIQCYVGSDGAIYAGGGDVKLSSEGIRIYGENLRFYYGTTYSGFIKPLSDGIQIGNTSGTKRVRIVATSDIVIDSNLSISLHTGSGYGILADGCDFIDLPRKTSAPTGVEGRMVYNPATGYLNVYSSGAWWHANRDAGWA